MEQRIDTQRTFRFYLSFEQVISELGEGDQLKLYKAISRYGLFGEQPQGLTGIAAACWTLIEAVLRKSCVRADAGRKGRGRHGKNRAADESSQQLSLI